MDDQALLSFGLWIKRRRRALDLTQEQLAASVGCSKDLIAKIEGDARRPSRAIAGLLADRLQLAPDERDAFIRCARAQLAPDQLPAPAAGVPLPALAAAPAGRAARGPPAGNLPQPADELIGRAEESAALLALLRDPVVRLVTLTGPGGIGKTRLALAAAAELAAAYADGAWFVDLAPLSDPAAVPGAIAYTLGLPEIAGQARLATLKAALRARQLLLLLDNCEQVAEAAPAVAELLAACPGLKVLATSRAALRLAGEHERLVAPLATPGTAAPIAPARLAEYDAVRLLCARAQAVRPGFQLTDANAGAVAAICAHLDGLPLAIELAAARVRLFPAETLLQLLQRDGGLGLLAGGPRDHPARQQTIRATIAWSERLLEPGERELLHRLSVFVGGWSLDAALAVGAADDGDEETALDRLEALVDHSLVVLLGGAAGEPRYAMLELVRVYALEQLRAAGAEQDARRRHADALARWAARLDAATGNVDVFARIRPERENINAALAWSLGAGGADATYALRIVARVWEYWSLCLHAEGSAWLRRALALVDQHTADPTAAHVLNAAGRMLWICGELDDPQPLLERGLALARRDGDRPLEAELLRHLGEYLFAVPGRLAEARRCFEESMAIGLACHDPLTELWGPVVLGLIALRTGRLDEARASFVPALAMAERRRDQLGQMVALRYMTEVAERQGRAAEAEDYLARAAQLARQLDQGLGVDFVTMDVYLAYLRRDYDGCLALLRSASARAQQYGQSYLLFVLASFEATLQLARGDLALAADAVRRALALHRRDAVFLARAATVAARIAARQGRYADAARLLGGVARLDQIVIVYLDDQPDPALERWRAEDARACQGVLGAAAFQRAWDAGQAIELAAAVAGALGECGPAAREAAG